MPKTLRDCLLEEGILSKTFNIYNPLMLGEDPKQNYFYTVRGLQKGTGSLYNQVILVAVGEDNQEHQFPLSYRLEDQFISAQPLHPRTAPTRTVANNKSVPDWNLLPD